MVKQYRNKFTGAIITAIIWEDNHSRTVEVMKFVNSKLVINRYEGQPPILDIWVGDFKHRAKIGDYIARDEEDELNVFDPTSFAGHYVPVISDDGSPLKEFLNNEVKNNGGEQPEQNRKSNKQPYNRHLAVILGPKPNDLFRESMGITVEREKELTDMFITSFEKHYCIAKVTRDISRFVHNPNEFAYLMYGLGMEISLRKQSLPTQIQDISALFHEFFTKGK